MSCGVGCRRGSDPALLWLWRRPVATAPIQPLAWEPPYAAGAAQEMAKRQKKKKKGNEEVQTIRCKIRYKDILYNMGNTANVLYILINVYFHYGDD